MHLVDYQLVVTSCKVNILDTAIHICASIILAISWIVLYRYRQQQLIYTFPADLINPQFISQKHPFE